MANISQNVNIEMLEKLADGTYKRKYPKTVDSQVEYTDTVQTNIKYKLVVIDEEPFLEVVEV